MVRATAQQSVIASRELQRVDAQQGKIFFNSLMSSFASTYLVKRFFNMIYFFAVHSFQFWCMLHLCLRRKWIYHYAKLQLYQVSMVIRILHS